MDQLIHPDGRVFEQGLRLLENLADTDEAAQLSIISKACARISTAQVMGPVERDRRITILLGHAPTSRASLQRLAEEASAWSPVAKNAIARFLPSEFKQLVYSRRDRIYADEHNTPIAPIVTQSTSTPPGVPREGATSSEEPPAVLLLGTFQEHEGNLNFLERKKFRPFRASSLEEYRKILSTDILGIVIGRSWWGIVPVEQHRPFLQGLFSHSSFVWIKVDLYGCKSRDDWEDDYRSTRYRDAQVREISSGESFLLHDSDLAAIQRTSTLVCKAMQVRLCPGEIEPSQAQVLIASVAEHVRDRQFASRFHLEKIATTTIQGGRTQALIFRVQPDDGGRPLIAKLDSVDRLRDEMGRFQHFIRPWDALLQPRFHYHGTMGVIIFGLVNACESPSNPAPTLDDMLSKLLRTESGAPKDGLPSETDLVALIKRAVEKIRQLNAQSCRDTTYESRAWISVETLNAMRQNGIEWQLPKIQGGIEPLELTHYAEKVLTGPLCSAATIHGDIHLRNILLRDFCDPFFIDYAYAGPGHPCYDLVRFKNSFLFQKFRMTANEDSIRSLLRVVTSTSVTLKSLRIQFPALCQSVGNRLALEAAISVREACLGILKQYGGSEQDYLSMELVVACQSLTIEHLQGGVVRAALVVAAELLAEQRLKFRPDSSPAQRRHSDPGVAVHQMLSVTKN